MYQSSGLYVARISSGGVEWEQKLNLRNSTGVISHCGIIKIRAILMKDNCLAAIGERPIDYTDNGEWNKMDGNTIANLHLALADGVLSATVLEEEGKGMSGESVGKTRSVETTKLLSHQILKDVLQVPQMMIASIGTIKINMDDGTVRTIQEVQHVQVLKKNLLCLGQIDHLGCKTYIENEILRIVRGVLVVIMAKKITSNIYMLKEETMQEADECVTSIVMEKSQR
ncbi:hypothetical protein EZV62_008261 [Acer yangbiense]|uniref:Retrovirus-related Pol polyprotein from transposon TNT 1-94-like beta-barrel domain-containing protein n=1 Tax=Acer yangbiense TaxID=1000413 RepID=A0A5C7IEY9_9ROSI|nr:hypothetical protein EZV62_008261 [Acer yangbiense]